MQSTPPEPEDAPQQLLLTIPQAAKRLGVSRAMIYSLIARRKGPPIVRLGRAVRVPVASLRKWVEELEQKQRS